MLTADLAISWRRGRTIGPRLVDPRNRELLGVAEELVGIVSRHTGKRRAELDAELEAYVGVGTDYKVLRGLIKLLEDRCEFAVAGSLEPADVRRAVFLAAAEHYPVTDEIRGAVIASAASSLRAPAEDVERALFGDLSQNVVLVAFDAPEPGALLEAYNLAQAQALLYRAVRMTLSVEPQPAEGYRRIFSAIKTYRLIHTISGTARDGYVVELDGPVSMFHRSQKYGIQMAVFLPALLACGGWSMEAEIEVKTRGPAYFSLTSRDTGLRSDYVRYAADRSPVVEKLLASWGAHGGEYSLEASSEVLDIGGEAFVPDLVLTAPDGRRVYIEVLGFWTPKTLASRLRALDAGHAGSYVLAAAEDFLASRDHPGDVPPHVLLFKSSLDPRLLRAAAERLLA